MGFGKDGKGVIINQSDTISLLTLASNSVEIQDNPLVMTDSFRMLKTEGSATITGATLVDGDGPIDLYLVSTDLSATEIAAAITVDGPVSREDRVADEVATRPVFKLTEKPISFRPPAAGGDMPDFSWSRKVRWTFGDGGSTGSFGIAAFNLGSGSLTTGASLRMIVRHYGVWVGA